MLPPDLQRRRLDAERFVELVMEGERGSAGSRQIGIVQQYRELVATQARHDVGRPNPAGEPLPHQGQQPVADVVPERVVDRLEPVAVDHEDGGPGRVVGGIQGGREVLVERLPVRQAGQFVGARGPAGVGQQRDLLDQTVVEQGDREARISDHQ
jgi:hypothetical protein